MKRLLATVALLTVLACGDDDSVTCGEVTCNKDQVCCADCDGSSVCMNSTDGTCPMISCDAAIDATSADGASIVDGSNQVEGGVCGGSGQVCCDPAPGDGPLFCNGGLQCCSGVPYPDEGECATTCDARSDRNAKHEFEEVDTQAVLETLRKLPIQRWRYDARPGEHIGPMAQDFHAAFALGESDKVIAGVDGQGVVMAAVQALADEVDRERAIRKALEARLAELEKASD